MKKRLKQTILFCLLFLGSGILYCKWYQGTGLAVPCFFHVITGLYCPGCGMTRCLSYLLQFKLKKAFRCNMAAMMLSPFLLYLLIYSLYSYIRYGKVTYSGKQNLMLGGCIIFLILFAILRNLSFFAFLRPAYGL